MPEEIHTEIEISSVVEQPCGYAPIATADVLLEDEFYIEGVIKIEVGDVPILSLIHWDLVDQLWDYIVTGLPQIEGGQPFKTYFPDQPSILAITPADDGALRVTATHYNGEKSALAHRETFLKALKSAAREFYEHLPNVAPTMKEHCDEQLLALSKLTSDS